MASAHVTVSSPDAAPGGFGKLVHDGGDADGLARWLGGAGLALGALALVIGILSMRRRTA